MSSHVYAPLQKLISTHICISEVIVWIFVVRVVLTVSTSCDLGHAQSRHRVNCAPGLQFTMVKRVASRLRVTGKVRGKLLYLKSFLDLL